MTDIEFRAQQLMHSIDASTQAIQDKIAQDDIDDLSVLLTQRFQLLTEFVALVSNFSHKKPFVSYLTQLDFVNQDIIQKLSTAQRRLKETLANLNHLKQYHVT